MPELRGHHSLVLNAAAKRNQGRAHRFRAGVVVPIFDFFRIADGKIKELRPYFDPKPLREAA